MNHKCLKDSQTKKYIVPTKEWLKPLKELITNDITSKGLIMLSKYHNSHDVVVKITKLNRQITQLEKIKFATKKLSVLPNFVVTLCSFNCMESIINIDTKYNEIDAFCYPDKNNSENEEIMLEIMKKYKGSLTNLIGKQNKTMVEHILKQLIYAQLNAFEKIGFLHMDMHLGNILYDSKLDNDIVLNYSFNKRSYQIKTSRIFYISDFDKCVIFDPNVELVKHNLNNLLILNIIKTLNKCLQLLSSIDDKNNFKFIIEKHLESIMHVLYEEKDLSSLYKKNKDLSEYKYDVISNCIAYLNKVWEDFFGSFIFPEHGLVHDNFRLS